MDRSSEYVTEALKVDDYQLFQVEPTEAQYIRITFIKGHLRSGYTDWDYSETETFSVGDLTGIHLQQIITFVKVSREILL